MRETAEGAANTVRETANDAMDRAAKAGRDAGDAIEDPDTAPFGFGSSASTD